MLILARKFGEKLLIGDDITITIERGRAGDQVRVHIDAPKTVRILRAEVRDEVERQNREAIAADGQLAALVAGVQVPRIPKRDEGTGQA
ncbi:carbon storage regulator [Agromyces humi]|uniref:carbon storage regulator n=1 Tax=Agromyces humi TaxID=1766800 RepID=UPI001358B74B|nr:carbon storage regulator [Agromyces humi]